MDPATRLVRSLPGNWYKLAEAAEMLEVSDTTLRTLIQEAAKTGDKAGAPSKYVKYGRNKIYLYSDDDIKRIGDLLSERREVRPFDAALTGRPRVYTPEEAAARKKHNARAWYYRNKIKDLQANGASRKDVSEAKRRLREIEDELTRTAKV